MINTIPSMKSKIIFSRLSLLFCLSSSIFFQIEGFSQKSSLHPFLRIDHNQCCINLDEPRGFRNSKSSSINDATSAANEFDGSCEACDTSSQISQSYIIDTIQYVGHSENTYDLVIMAEGYTEGQIPRFRYDAKKVKESLLKNDVYPKLLPKMNIFSIATVSMESGISLRTRSPLPTDPIQTPKIKNTFFGIYFLNSFRAYFLDDTTTFKAKNLASEFIPFSELVLILTNDDEYSSGRASFFGVAVASRFKEADSLWSDYLFNHELAHSIGGIADEYFGAGKEIAFNKDITNDPSKIRWKDQLNLPGCGIESVEPGVYIPNKECMMRMARHDYTCPVCSLRLSNAVQSISNKIPEPHRVIMTNYDKDKRTVTYTWDPIPQATNYEIVFWAFWRNDFISKTTTDNSVTFDLTPEDVLSIPSWTLTIQIRAFNAISSTRFQYFRTSIYTTINLSAPIASAIKQTSENSYKIVLSSKDQAEKMNWFRLYNEEGLHTDILTFRDTIELKNLRKDKKYFYQIAATFPAETRDFFASPFSQKLPLLERPNPPVPKDIEVCQFDNVLPTQDSYDVGNTLRWYVSDTSTIGSLLPPQNLTQNVGIFRYFITQVNSQGGESLMSPVNIRVKPKYNPPDVQDKEYCQNINWPSIVIKPDTGNTLKWYTSDTSSSGSINNPVLSINTFNPGLTSYFVTQTNPEGCESNKAKFEVRINPQPSRPETEESEVCQNTKITSLKVKADDGNQLLWYTTVLGGVANQTIPDISTSMPGFAKLWVTQVSNKGCESLNSQVSITIRPQPAMPTLTLLNNLEIRSSAAKNIWLLNNSLLPDTLQSILPKVSGNYTAIALEKQCQSQPSLALSFISTSFLDEELMNLTFYPNPFSDFITINYENTDKVISKIDFISLTGGVVKSVENLDSRTVIDVTDLSAGIYFLRVQIETTGRRPFFKLIKY
jgi:hypothetical protein